MPFLDDPISPPSPPPQHDQGRRVALVIGNGRYAHATTLRNPANDAGSMATALEALGFEVVGGGKDGIDLDKGEFSVRIRDFARQLRDGAEVATALLYYAGHGLQVEGRNYLVPVDAVLEFEADIGSELFELQHILNEMERPRRTSIVLLDACRNNPLARNLARAMGLDVRSAGITEGLAEQKVVAGTLIAYATHPGHVAYDGDGQNGFFTEALLAHLATPGREVELMLKDVRSKVVMATADKSHGPQVPWVNSSLVGAFYFKSAPNDPAIRLDHAASEWARLKDTNDKLGLRRLAQYFPGYFGDHALDRIADIEREEEAALASAKALAQVEAQQREYAALVRLHDTEWQATMGDGSAAAYERFLVGWNQGPHVAAARKQLVALQQQQRLAEEQQREVEALRAAEADAEKDRREGRLRIAVGDNDSRKFARLKPGESVRDLDIAPELVLVPPGQFMMGSKNGKGNDEERPEHRVTISYPLLVGKYPVTFAEWDSAVAAGGVIHKPANNIRASRHPVTDVNWHDAKEYVTWLSTLTGQTYRLLSEAEWEYCCRAGSTTEFWWGDQIASDQASYSGINVKYDSSHKGIQALPRKVVQGVMRGLFGLGGRDEALLWSTTPVDKFRQNQFGLYDMHGNTFELCEDIWSGHYNGAPVDGAAWTMDVTPSSRVARGGAYIFDSGFLRSASRIPVSADFRGDFFGFRVARSIRVNPVSERTQQFQI
jgi:formylglycine-generating enzyme required for sulfatase activity